MIALEAATAADAQQIIVTDVGRADFPAEFLALLPFDFNRWHRKEERAGKVAFASDSGLRDGFFDHEFGKAFGETHRRKRLDRNEVDCPSHRGPEPFDGKAGQRSNPGLAGR